MKLSALYEDASEPGVWTSVKKGPRKGASQRTTRAGAYVGDQCAGDSDLKKKKKKKKKKKS